MTQNTADIELPRMACFGQRACVVSSLALRSWGTVRSWWAGRSSFWVLLSSLTSWCPEPGGLPTARDLVTLLLRREVLLP